VKDAYFIHIFSSWRIAEPHNIHCDIYTNSYRCLPATANNPKNKIMRLYAYWSMLLFKIDCSCHNTTISWGKELVEEKQQLVEGLTARQKCE
jgi:hypothetical protein